MDEISAHEASPLLSTTDTEPHPPKRPAPWYQLRRPSHIALLTCLGVFLWVLSGTLAIVPATRLSEDIFCHLYYHRLDGDIEEELCKVEEVQSRMAYLFSFVFMLDGLVGLVVAFPFGVMADRARKPVYILGTMGQSLNVAWTLLVLSLWRTLPIELIILAPVFQLLGGGLMVATSVLYAMLADVLGPENRATWFFFFSLSAQAAGFIGMPIGAKMMDVWSPWAPLSITLLLGPLNGLLMIFMPETLSPERKSTREETLVSTGDEEGWWMAFRSQFRHQIRNAWGSLAIFSNRSVALLLVCFVLIAPAVSGLAGIFLQYFSKRFHRTLAEAGYVLAVRGGLVMLVMGIILPGLTKLLSHPRARLSAYRRDLILARGSAICLFVGLVLISGPDLGFVISGLVVVTLSSGISPLCRSLVTNFIVPEETSRLFTMISIIETIGTLPCGPLLAWAFSTGMRLKGFWYGLPFLFLALLGLGALVALFLLRAPDSSAVTVVRPGDEESRNGTTSPSHDDGLSELDPEEPGI